MRVVFATETTSVAMPGGYPLGVQKGSHWAADDPLVQEHPDLFSDDPRYGMSYSQPQREESVEQATAGPGEQRHTVRPQVDQAFDEMAELRAEAERAGIEVDRRWGLARLRQELSARGRPPA
jgi:hypothetical protein